jgi:hypothetical protein
MSVLKRIYRIHQNVCRGFKQLQLRDEKRYEAIGTCSVVVKSNIFTDISAYMCAQILEHNNFLSRIVFINEANFHSSGGSIGISVSFWALSLPENI